MLYSFNECWFIVDPINTTPQMISYSVIYHMQYDMFRPVIMAIVG